MTCYMSFVAVRHSLNNRQLVGWSLTSHFSTNTAISEMIKQ